MTVKFVKSQKTGRIGVETPYNANFVTELKSLVPSAKWNRPHWFFDEVSRATVDSLVEKYFGGEPKYYRIVWSDLSREENLIVDGQSLAFVTRDNWNWRHNSDVQFTVIENGLSSGGSRQYPGLFGSCTIDAFVRNPESISPAPDSIEEIEPPQTTSNALPTLKDEAEIARLQTSVKALLGEPNMTDMQVLKSALGLVEIMLGSPVVEAAMAKAETDDPGVAIAQALLAYVKN